VEYVTIIDKIKDHIFLNRGDDILLRNKKYCIFFESLLDDENTFLHYNDNFEDTFLTSEDLNLTLNMMFNASDIHSMVLFFYNIKDFESLFFYNNLFGDEFLSNISYCPDVVLSKDKSENVMSFLFLYFHPYMKDSENMWTHPIHDKLIMLFANITNKNFDLLYYLFNEDALTVSEGYKNGFNLCHQLIEFYLDNVVSTAFYRNKSNDWKEYGFPIYKIKKLIKEGFCMDSFLKVREDKKYFTCESMAVLMKEIVIECDMERLEVGINKKQINVDSVIIKV